MLGCDEARAAECDAESHYEPYMSYWKPSRFPLKPPYHRWSAESARSTMIAMRGVQSMGQLSQLSTDGLHDSAISVAVSNGDARRVALSISMSSQRCDERGQEAASGTCWISS